MSKVKNFEISILLFIVPYRKVLKYFRKLDYGMINVIEKVWSSMHKQFKCMSSIEKKTIVSCCELSVKMGNASMKKYVLTL